MRKHGADFGIARDGDFDYCFLFDEKGAFIEGYYIVGLLDEVFLQKEHIKSKNNPTARDDAQGCASAVRGGAPIQSKTGHAFIKECIRAENAIYGGEMSAHYYFRDFAYCDSGMILCLLITELLGTTGRSLSELVVKRMAAYRCSGGINYRVQDVQSSIAQVRAYYEGSAEPGRINTTDGLSMEFSDWRCNLRTSNTEPLLRLNIESRGDSQIVKQHVAEIEALIKRGRDVS